jgi:hypothetical protein
MLLPSSVGGLLLVAKLFYSAPSLPALSVPEQDPGSEKELTASYQNTPRNVSVTERYLSYVLNIDLLYNFSGLRGHDERRSKQTS